MSQVGPHEEEGMLPESQVKNEVAQLRLALARQQKFTLLSVAFACLALSLSASTAFSGATSGKSGAKSTSALQPTQLWAGVDSDLVPEEFTYCNSAGWPAQMAPVRRSGDFLFFSGILGYDEPCKSAEKDASKQVEVAFGYLDRTLKAAGVGWIDLVSVTSYHVNMGDHVDEFLAQRQKYLSKGPYPAWTSVSVPKLFFDHEVLELTAVARVPPCASLEC
jgi:enamine deaminase RidA (YjgF/YER057c/UK114 family)